jgi:SnoaL-like domain
MKRRTARALTTVGTLMVLCARAMAMAAESGVADASVLQRLQTLQLRATRLEDINAIKRLQRTYGYYVDEAQWDDVADLFAPNASIEIGLDGVYQGRQRIRQYLKAMGNGKVGLAPGQLNEYLQLMPVISVDGNGRTARGTWRAVILAGQLGKNAFWGEGPYENEYIKEGGIWKISRLHWFQTLYVPYEGGWANHGDVNGGHFVGGALHPDAPSTVAYKTWPSAYTPPFHFRGQYPGLVTLPATLVTGTVAAKSAPARAAQLGVQVQRLVDQNEIERLQRVYGYYIDKGQWSDAAALFTVDAKFEIQGRGIFRGPTGVLRYLRAVGPEGLQSGRLYEHMQLQPVVHVSDDGRSAKGRWHLFAQLASAGKFQEWATGIYENDYAKQDGVWKIRRLHLYPTMTTPYESGWGKSSLRSSSFEPNIAADSPSQGKASQYDQVFMAPFHYAHPVRSARRAANTFPAPVTDVQDALAKIETSLDRAEDVASIENLQTTYGYYLATLLWDDLAGLFADDGTIEIALRGIYVGKAAVRRNLNLYGQAGLDDGVLHNHMQYQPVIDVAGDGLTAKLRSRALSMMGNFGKNATWMGGVYENEFVKIDGKWKFHKDQVMNTYFAPYEVGWKDLAQRPAPGITPANPPDLPPSFHFDLYPKNFLPPYHYHNPAGQ